MSHYTYNTTQNYCSLYLLYIYTVDRAATSGTRDLWVVGHCIMYFNESKIREYKYLRIHKYIINKLSFYYVILCRLSYSECNEKYLNHITSKHIIYIIYISLK